MKTVSVTFLETSDPSDPLNVLVLIGIKVWLPDGSQWGTKVVTTRIEDPPRPAYAYSRDREAALAALVKHLILNPPPEDVAAQIRASPLEVPAQSQEWADLGDGLPHALTIN